MSQPDQNRPDDGRALSPGGPHHSNSPPSPSSVPDPVPVSHVIEDGSTSIHSRAHSSPTPAFPRSMLGGETRTREQYLRSRVNSNLPDVECCLKNTYHRYEFSIVVTRPDVYCLSCSYPPNLDKPERDLPQVYRRRNRCAAEGVAAKLGEIFVTTGSIPERFIFVYRAPNTHIAEVSADDDIDNLLHAFETTSYSVAGYGAIPDWQGRLDEELERLAAQRRSDPNLDSALGG